MNSPDAPSLWDVPGLTQRSVDRGQRGRSRKTDPPTSAQAASAISNSCEQAIRALFSVPRQLTDTELCDLLPEWYGPTVVSARVRLSKRDHKTGRPPLLRDSGVRRLSARKRSSIVWERSS